MLFGILCFVLVVILYISIGVGSYGFFKFIRDTKKSSYKDHWSRNISITTDDESLSISCVFWFIGVPIILSRNIGIIIAFLFIALMDKKNNTQDRV